MQNENPRGNMEYAAARRDPRHSKGRNVFHQTMHVLILFFLVWIVIVYFQANQILVGLHHSVGPSITWLISWIPYIQWLADASQVPEVTQAFLDMIYLCFFMLFLNLFFAVFPAFHGVPKSSYLLSVDGFADFLEEHVFSRLSPSISLVAPIERLWGRGTRGRRLIEANSYKQVIIVYLRKYAVVYYGGLAFGSFIFLPWIAHIKVSYTGSISVPFLVAALAFTYIQVRLVFEWALLLLFLSTNEKTREV
jgi:hypothetical protein